MEMAISVTLTSFLPWATGRVVVVFFFFLLFLNLTDTNVTAISLKSWTWRFEFYHERVFITPWSNKWSYESKHTDPVKSGSRSRSEKIACCAVLLTFIGLNNDKKKVFTGQIATIFMIKYSYVLAEVLVQWWGLERSSIQTLWEVKFK